MPPASSAPRKRTRKRKRRALFRVLFFFFVLVGIRCTSRTLPPRRDSPSPPPPSPTLPSFLPPADAPNFEDAEKEMKARFRTFWMASVADGFKDDLEQIRVKEPNLGQSRLALLIDSLASGADVFSSTADGVNEMEVVLE
ncbi:hypothetical protein C8F01DRAFT_1251610 [Mycena amicta]|nr:hypothetical protein C8F01DRAFT_1251610 [Mycena amicta]